MDNLMIAVLVIVLFLGLSGLGVYVSVKLDSVELSRYSCPNGDSPYMGRVPYCVIPATRNK